MKKGAEMKCKIIQLDAEEKRCVLTAKKTLIKSPLPLIDNFDNLKLGQETYGTVVSIQQYGLLLSFLNDLKGLLPRQQISTSEAVRSEKYDLKEIYYVGQLVKCKVFKYDRQRRQVKLSLIMKNEIENDKESVKEAPQSNFSEEYEVGDLIESATILQVNEENQYFRLKLPRGVKNGLIYKNHLSDMECLNDILFDCYKRSMKIKNLMITQYSNIDKTKLENINNNKQCHYLTLKTTLIDQYTNMAKSEINKKFSDLQMNQWQNGWIKKVLAGGLLVEMPYNLTGFTSNQDVSYLEELKSSVTNGLSIGQSALIKIGKLFNDKQQFITSIRTRHSLMQTNSRDIEFMISLFKSYLINTKRVLSEYGDLKTVSGNKNNPIAQANRNLWEKAAQKIKIGSVVKIMVKQFNMITRQIECVFVDDLNEENNYKSSLVGIAFADDDEKNMNKYSPGAKFDALVLAFDPLAKTFCLTVDSKQIKIYKKNFDSKFRAQAVHKAEQVIKAEILYVSQWFCIVGLKAHALGHLAFMPLFKNDFTQLNTARDLNEESSKFWLPIEAKIRKQQLLKVSHASLKHLENTNSDSKLTKDDRHFAYYCVGQIGKVCIKTDNFTDMDYTLAVHDLSTLNQNRKSLLRQLAILNENCADSDNLGSKRKLSESDEPILVKKKINTDNPKDKPNKKRKLTEINGNHDSIEIVADVKNATNSKKFKPEESETISAFKYGVDIPSEINDFDQFNRILNSLNPSNGEDKENGNESDSSDENDDKKKKSKKAKKAKDKSEFINDKNLLDVEERAFDPDRAPESVEDYERMLVASPNSSLLWIKYMAFHLQLGDSDKARGVAHKGLSTIAYREESERLNVWVALLNMENMFGTQANIDDTFNRATQNCDSFKVHSHMAEIYARSDKLQEAEEVFMKMTKKFASRQDVWVKYAVFHYKNSNCELARKLLIRSFGSLDKKEHVEMVNKFAQLEFKYGDIERAKTMYDSLLFTYQNRTDIWSVYIDMLVKSQKIDDARAVFNRIVGLGLTVKRMKFIFKKFLDFEKTHGHEDTIEKVKETASKYVESNNATKSGQSESHNNENKSDEVEANLKKKLQI